LVENKKGRPTKGKVYQLAIMEYQGPDEIPIIKKEKPEVIDYQWVNEKEGINLIKSLRIYNFIINTVFSMKESQESLI